MEAVTCHPVTVVGGGIAGLSLGIGLLRSGVPVTLIEASSYPRHRVCGEFISGVSRETLEQLGVADLLDDAAVCRETVWHDRNGPVLSKTLPVPALGISRYRLDQRMAERFRALGGELRENERFRETGTHREGIVLATGRFRNLSSPWLGLKGHLLEFRLEADLEMHLGTGGYIGLNRIEDGRVNACGLFRIRHNLKGNGKETLVAYLKACRLDRLVERIGDARLDPDSLAGVSAFQFGPQKSGLDGPLCIGDRSSLIGPFTGNGMSMAFQSAALLLPGLTDYSLGKRNWPSLLRESEPLLRRSFRRRLGVSRLLQPFLTSRAGQSAIACLAKRDWLPFSLLYRATR